MPRWKRSDSVERAQLATSLRAAGPLQGWRAHIGLGLTLIAIEPAPANSRTSSYRLAHRGTGSGLSLVEVGEWLARGLMLAAQGAKVAQQHGRRWWPACTLLSRRASSATMTVLSVMRSQLPFCTVSGETWGSWTRSCSDIQMFTTFLCFSSSSRSMNPSWKGRASLLPCRLIFYVFFAKFL